MSEYWQRFVSGDDRVAEIRPGIRSSWLRCRQRQISPERIVNDSILTAPALRERLRERGELVRAGKPVLPDVFRCLEGRNFVVLLCDEEGYILESLGDAPFISRARQVHLCAGANWSEEVKGTNAIGTVLVEQQPVKVLGWEHYVRENHFLNCWAAPIRDASGRIAGVLDISGEAGGEGRIWDLVYLGARLVEQNLLLLSLERDCLLSRRAFELASGLLREGFITVDAGGILTSVNQAGARLLGRRREEAVGRHVSEVLSSRSFVPGKSPGSGTEMDGGLVSKLCQVTDPDGFTLGMVGILRQAPPAGKDVPAWVGSSEITQNICRRAEKAARTNSTVLVTGESGTGKEIVARLIHQAGDRCRGPFVAVNCAAIPDSLIESELFGYAEGAFTGAKRGGQPGKFETAAGGTIFLDEIGDMPLAVQASLLRVLQEREVCRIGDTKARKVDVRVVAATNKDLAALIAKGAFRPDLYYRLKVVTIDVPPLRQRTEDIFDLVPYFVDKATRSMGRPPLGVAKEVFDCLLAYPWPGNVRELENCIESMVAMCEGGELSLSDLPDEIRYCARGAAGGESILERQARQAILRALWETGGRIAPAARLLGMGRSTLYRKLAELGINETGRR